MNIGEGIRVMLARNSMSQSALAREVKVTRPYICSLCNNDKIPSTLLLKKISNVLGCKVSDLLIEGGE